ncbi:MAG TPA: hypothetical protein VGJ59_21700 [Jatrophihabitantaceae bacterium]|jgi:hypothetical protein
MRRHALIGVTHQPPFVVPVIGRLARRSLRVELDDDQVAALQQLIKQARLEASTQTAV